MNMSTRAAFEDGPLSNRRNGGNPHHSDDDAVDVRELFRVVWRGRYLIGLFMLACAVATALFVSTITPKYAAAAKVLLDPRESQVITDDQVVSDLDLSDQVMDSEISIITSNLLLESVIEDLGLDSLSELDSANQSPSLLGRIKSGLTGSGAESDTLSGAEHAAAVESMVWALRKKTEVWRQGDSYIILIRVETESPTLSARLASSIAEQYIAMQLEGRQATAAQATLWIEQRVADLREQVKIAEGAVQDYRAGSLEDEGSSVDIITQQMIELNNQLVNTRVERVSAETRFSELKRLVDTGGLGAPAGLLTSSSLEELAAERNDLLRRDAQWAERYPTTHPERTRIKRQLDQLAAVAQVELRRVLETQRNELDLVVLREETLKTSLSELEQRSIAASRDAIGLRQLEREASAARTSYEELLSRLAETRTQEKFQTADARLIERASIPGSPSAPRPKLMTFVGALIGIGLGLGFVLFRELTNPTFKSVRTVEAETGLPVLSTLPKSNWRSPKQALEDLARNPFGITAERVRKMRTSLSLNTDRMDASKSVILLSSLPDEGKTTLTLLLAQMSELADKTVIVLDLDLRRSSLQDLFKWRQRHDLGDVLRGRASIDDAINYDTGLGFDVLAAKGVQPEAADLLSTDLIAQMLDHLKYCYDIVLVNSPALLAVSDALLMAKMVDQRIYVVEHDKTPRDAVMRGLNTLSDAGLDVSGIVMTKVDLARHTEPYATSYEAYHV